MISNNILSIKSYYCRFNYEYNNYFDHESVCIGDKKY